MFCSVVIACSCPEWMQLRPAPFEGPRSIDRVSLRELFEVNVAWLPSLCLGCDSKTRRTPRRLKVTLETSGYRKSSKLNLNLSIGILLYVTPCDRVVCGDMV